MRRFAFQGRDTTADADDPAYFVPGELPLSRAKKSRRLFRRVVVATMAAFGVACALALHHAGDGASSDISSQATPPAPLPAWIEIANPAELFTVTSPELVKRAKIYTAREHRTGGGRQDTLVSGDLNGAGPVLRLVIYHVGKEAAAPAAFFVDLARRAAETGRAITFAAQPTALSTRLGVFEAADLVLTQTGSADAPCLGFRLAYAASLRLTGFACGGKNETAASFASKAKLACLLDTLELAPKVDDKDLVAFFAARELNDDTACDGADERRSLQLVGDAFR
ncbi:MAG: hypothetical protein WDN46_00495 [Methylocella sp.]